MPVWIIENLELRLEGERKGIMEGEREWSSTVILVIVILGLLLCLYIYILFYNVRFDQFGGYDVHTIMHLC